MRRFGRGMQVLGLVLPPLGMILELSHTISLVQMLLVLVASACLWGIGRILEGYAS